MIISFKNKILLNVSKEEYLLDYSGAKKDLRRILNYVASELDEKKTSVGIHLVSKDEIHKLNLETREIDKPTDVLSYPMGEEMDKSYYLGDIFINADLISAQAEEINSDTLTELKFLFMHGLLHLIGHDHKTEEDEEKMTAKQREIFRTLGIRE
jgi:probable rRNA maturation factor